MSSNSSIPLSQVGLTKDVNDIVQMHNMMWQNYQLHKMSTGMFV